MYLIQSLILNGYLFLSGVWLAANIRMGTERHVLTRDWTAYFFFVIHSKHNIGHN